MSDDRKPAQPLRIPGITETTGTQVAILLSIVHNTLPLCLKGAGLTQVETGDRPDLDGGVSTAASVTLVRTLDRLDRILDDNARWGDGGIVEQTRLINDNLRTAQLETQERLVTLREARRPSRNLPIRIFFDVQNAVWVVTAEGIPGTPSLFGAGKTPAEALLRFDLEYFHSETAQKAEAAAELEKAEAAKAAPAETPKRPSRKRKTQDV